jgi:hypothetical protein
MGIEHHPKVILAGERGVPLSGKRGDVTWFGVVRSDSDDQSIGQGEDSHDRPTAGSPALSWFDLREIGHRIGCGPFRFIEHPIDLNPGCCNMNAE